MVDIIISGTLIGINDLADAIMGFEWDLLHRAGEDQILNLALQLIGELEALAVEDLNTVVLKGVVGGRDDYAGVGLSVHCHPGHGWGGDDAQMENVGTGGAQTGSESTLQQVGGDTSVLTNGHQGLAALLPTEDLGRGQAHLVCQHGVQPGVDHAADAVGPE